MTGEGIVFDYKDPDAADQGVGSAGYRNIPSMHLAEGFPLPNEIGVMLTIP